MIVRFGTALAALALGVAPASPAPAADEVRLNQIQVVGSHNSYHIAPYPTVVNLMIPRFRPQAKALDYTHPPLAEQLSRAGVRQIELDIYPDPEGGRYADPPARKVLKTFGRDAGPDPDIDGVLRRPGWKILHIPEFDFLSTTPTFVAALEQVRDWSKAHPDHVPILVLVEVKDWAILQATPPIGRAELDTIDAAIYSVFPREGLLLPDDVRGDSATLPEAIRSRGWPRLSECRGKVYFALDNEGSIRDDYLADHPALQGRAMFANVAPDHPAAAWMKRNDAIAEFDEIRSLVAAGFLVRTRTDIDTAEARRNDPTRRDKALASGAQFLSSDFFEPRPDISPYAVRFPNHAVARPNPVSGAGLDPAIDLEPAR
ncbi:Ca2+-dependent phosphoinositide-specific phospholipase C [Tundrisphaera sp. TA3]|uniref:Ca2+-dependent phosphoinositide-specific phospholipase C n=1 Tax=Tundrisphaera sp. TA3 TaxID=3435775 RepID=UPI003EB7D507